MHYAEAKRLATLKARAALHGILVEATTDNAGPPLYAVSMQARTRHVGSMAEVAVLLEILTGETPEAAA